MMQTRQAHKLQSQMSVFKRRFFLTQVVQSSSKLMLLNLCIDLASAQAFGLKNVLQYRDIHKSTLTLQSQVGFKTLAMKAQILQQKLNNANIKVHCIIRVLFILPYSFDNIFRAFVMGKNSNKFMQWIKNGDNLTWKSRHLAGILLEQKVLFTFRYALHIVVNCQLVRDAKMHKLSQELMQFNLGSKAKKDIPSMA